MTRALRYLTLAVALAIFALVWPLLVQRLDGVNASASDPSGPYASVPLPELPASAATFSPPNNRWIQYAEYNQIIPQVARSSTLTWVATDNYGWPKWHDVVGQSLDTGSPYAQSLGNVMQAFIQVRERQAGETGHLNERAESAPYVAGKCGGSFATACIYIYDNLPVNVYFNASAMITFIFTGQAAVVEHESFHGLTNACDQYVGGCPPTNNQPFTCTGNPETLMDCGLAARYPQYYDVITFLGAYTPDHVSGVNFQLSNGWVALSWNCDRKDGGFASAFLDSCHVATRVAFAFAKRGEEPTWAGSLGCSAQFDFCFTDPALHFRWFDPYWTTNFDCGFLRLENGPTWFVAQSSSLGLNGSQPDGYWQFVACWR